MRTILVIEDEQDIRENLVDLLEASDYTTLVADNGADGLQLARAHLPDLILCDVMMPTMDGFDVVAEVRKHDALTGTPFIFLTAKSTSEDLRRGMTTGADDYLTKPFKAAELFDAIESRMERFDRVKHRQERRMAQLHQSISEVIPHELRTPLVAVEGFTSLLLDDWDELEAAMAKDMLHDVMDATQRLKRLVERNALFAQLISQSPPDVDAPGAGTDSAAAEDRARNVARSHDRHADLAFDLAPGTVTLKASMFGRLVEELVDNACKFSPGGSPIRVSGTARAEAYALTVTDAGRGLHADQLQEISAYRQFNRREHEQQGSGLGLVLCRAICERAGGSINIESDPERGTTVRVVLPLAQRAAAPPPSAPRAAS